MSWNKYVHVQLSTYETESIFVRLKLYTTEKKFTAPFD